MLEQLHRLRQLQRLPANRKCPRTEGSMFVSCNGVLISKDWNLGRGRVRIRRPILWTLGHMSLLSSLLG